MAGDTDPIFNPKHDGMQTHAVNGAIATTIAQIVKIPFQAASILILPRLLSPEDYGIYYAVVPLISLSLLLHGVGIHQAIIQSPALSRGHVAALFWISTITGILGGALFFLAAPLVAHLLSANWDQSAYADPRVTTLMAACAFFVVWAGVMNIPRAIMNRQMKFGWLAVIDAAGVGLGLLAGIAAAEMGAHYWALAIDYAVTCLVGLLGVWLLVGWLPTDKPDFNGIWRFFRFGGGLMASDILTLASRWGDNVIIGNRMSAAELGNYGQGNRLANTPLERIFLLFERLLLPILSRMVDNAERYRRAYLRIIRQLMLFMVPGTVAVGVTAPILIPFLLGDDWAGAAPIFAWLTIVALHQPVSMTMIFLFTSQRRAADNFIWSLFSVVTSLGAVLIGVQWGAVTAAAAFALSDILLRMPFLWWIVTRKGPIRMRDLYGAAAPFAAAALAIYLALTALTYAPFPSAFIELAVNAILAYAIGLGVVSLFKGGRGALADTVKLFNSETRRLLLRRGREEQPSA